MQLGSACGAYGHSLAQFERPHRHRDLPASSFLTTPALLASLPSSCRHSQKAAPDSGSGRHLRTSDCPPFSVMPHPSTATPPGSPTCQFPGICIPTDPRCRRGHAAPPPLPPSIKCRCPLRHPSQHAQPWLSASLPCAALSACVCAGRCDAGSCAFACAVATSMDVTNIGSVLSRIGRTFSSNTMGRSSSTTAMCTGT